MRGDGACGRGGAIGAAGFVASGAAGCGAAGGGGTITVAAACVTGGCAAIAAGAAAVAGGCGTDGAGAENVGLGVEVGTITLGDGAAGGVGSVGAFTVDGAAGEALTGGCTEGAAAVTGACCLRIAFRTSPGREILERSILVLISSLSARLGRECLVEVCVSLRARK
jgi:hypothetical protein